MATPKITISSQARVGTNLDVEGWITGASSATVRLPSTGLSGGGVSKAAVPITIRANGFFSTRITAIVAGEYAGPIVDAISADGETATATGIPQRIYANGTAPIGHPVVSFPPKAIPVPVPSVAMGAVVTDIKLVNLANSVQTGMPFTIGQPFKKGALAPTDFLVGKIGGQADVPLQFNVKSTHFDGSVRHAIISGIAPTLAANETKTVSLVRSSSGALSHVAGNASALIAAGFNAEAIITVGGVAYKAEAATGLASAVTWFGGEVSNDFTVAMPMKAVDGTNQQSITGHFYVRHYPASNKVKLDVCLEHSKAYGSLTDVTYDVTLSVGGTSLFTQAGVVHFTRGRWKKTYWWNGEPTLHVQHNVDYLLASKAVSNYDKRFPIAEYTLNQYDTEINDPKFGIMKSGRTGNHTIGPGAKPQLGIAPDTHAVYILSQDIRAKRMMLAMADAAGCFAVHVRDDSTGPQSGKPLDVNHFPKAAVAGTFGDATNSSTGQVEHLLKLDGYSTSPMVHDTAHQWSPGYVAYLLTGDYYYLEELLFWCHNTMWSMNPGAINLNPSTTGNYYRQQHRGSLCAGQLRAQAWGMRSLLEAAAIVPNDDPIKPSLNYWVEQNAIINDAFYTDNPNAPALHFIDRGGVVIYPNDNPSATTYKDQVEVGTANFQEDFIAQTANYGLNLGFEVLRRFVFWKVKWQVERIIGVGTCWIHACIYNSIVRNTKTSPYFTTMAEVQAASIRWPTVHALPCGSQERLDELNRVRDLPSNPYIMGEMTGYAYNADSFVANLQPALAAAVDVGYPDADLAWMQFDGRSVKPTATEILSRTGYGNQPQFSIVPYGYVAPDVVDPVDPPDEPVEPPPDVPPTTPPTDDSAKGPLMNAADRVKETTTATSTVTITLLGPVEHYRPVLNNDLPIGTTDIPISVDDKAGKWENALYTLTNGTTLTRQQIVASSNGGNAVAFDPGVKTVSVVTLASEFKKLAGPHSPVVTSFNNPDTASVLVLEGKNVKQMSVANFFATYGTAVGSLGFASSTNNTDSFLIAQNGVERQINLTNLASAIGTLIGSSSPPVTSDTTGPSLPNALSTSSVTQTTATLNWQAATDANGIQRYEYSYDAATWIPVGTNLYVDLVDRTPGAFYTMRVRAIDPSGNPSEIRSIGLTMAAASGDDTDPTMSGSMTFTAITSSGYTINWTAGTDNVSVDHYEISLNNGVSWSNVGNVTSYTVSDATSKTTYNPRVRAHDPAGNTSNVLTASVETLATPATAITLVGPTNGLTSTASSNFTVGVNPVGGSFNGSIVVTPTDNGSSGTFAPTTVTLTEAAPTATFKYTPNASAGQRTISLSNNGGLADPAGIVYTAAVPTKVYTVRTHKSDGTAIQYAMYTGVPAIPPTQGTWATGTAVDRSCAMNVRVQVLDADLNAPENVKFVYAESDLVADPTGNTPRIPPGITYASTDIPPYSVGNATVRTGHVVSGNHYGGWTQAVKNAYYAIFGIAGSLYAWQEAATMGVTGTKEKRFLCCYPDDGSGPFFWTNPDGSYVYWEIAAP